MLHCLNFYHRNLYNYGLNTRVCFSLMEEHILISIIPQIGQCTSLRKSNLKTLAYIMVML